MIKIKRSPEPNVLKKNKKRWKKEYLEAVALYNTRKTIINKKRILKAEGRYNHREVKKALNEMCCEKCSYCESHISHVSYGHIEHFKPKSKFPEFCFEWENFLLGCAVCNGKQYKSDNFPEKNEGGPFINPTTESPEYFFEFEFDPETGTANVLPKNTRAKTTEIELGLNRPELVKHRSDVVRKIAYVALQAKNGDNHALDELHRCMDADQEYAAFARAFHQRFKLA